jgi:hypothetical protein
LYRVVRIYIWGKVVSFKIKVNFFENGIDCLFWHSGKTITGLICKPFLFPTFPNLCIPQSIMRKITWEGISCDLFKKKKTKLVCTGYWWFQASFPSYWGNSDQEDLSLKPAQANSVWDRFSKKSITKRTSGVAQDVGPWVQTPVTQKKDGMLCTSFFLLLQAIRNKVIL